MSEPSPPSPPPHALSPPPPLPCPACIDSSPALQRALLSLSSHALRRVFGPPNFGLSRQFLQAPQSAVKSPGNFESGSGRGARASPPGAPPPIPVPPGWLLGTAAGAPPPPWGCAACAACAACAGATLVTPPALSAAGSTRPIEGVTATGAAGQTAVGQAAVEGAEGKASAGHVTYKVVRQEGHTREIAPTRPLWITSGRGA